MALISIRVNYAVIVILTDGMTTVLQLNHGEELHLIPGPTNTMFQTKRRDNVDQRVGNISKIILPETQNHSFYWDNSHDAISLFTTVNTLGSVSL